MTKIDDKRVPALRFKGFNDDWAQRKLGKLSKIKSGQTPSSHDNSNYYPPQINWIRTGDLTNSKIISVDKLLSKKGAEKLTVFPKNTVVIAMYGGFNQIGRTGLLTFPSTINQALAAISPNPLINSNFLLQLLNKNIYTWRRVAASSRKDPNITKKDIENQKFDFPSLFEQEKISKLISLIDKLITLQQRKEKILKQIQQAIYYNIYPEYGTKIPIIRHREFNKDWSIVSFNKLYKKSKEKNDLTYGEDKIISVAKMYFKHESQNSSKDYLKTYNVFKKGDIAFEGNRSEGFSHGRFVQNNIGDGIVSHVFDVFTPLKKENLNYWKYAIHNEHIMKYILVKSTTKATMMNNLSTKDFLKQKIAVPNSREMKKISHLLKRLDDQLEFSKRKIKLLTKVKQFLLQNMFI